jgi:mono/diheme cytochrome c family protein
MRLSLVVAFTLLVAACGGSSGGGTKTASSGEQVFKDNCVNCHTLKAAGATGQVGPNLDNLKPSQALVVHQVTNGGGGMPPFGGKLTDAQIKAVAQYVSSNAGK